MRTRQVPFTEWRGTLDDLSRSFAGALVSLEVVGGEVGAEEEVCNQPLRGITSDRNGVTVQIEKAGGIHLSHRIAHPQKVRIVESMEGSLIAVEIEDHGGVQNLVRFLTPARAELFDRAVE
jgi:hypothetical protein